MKLSKDFRNGSVLSLAGTLVLTSGVAGAIAESGITIAIIVIVLGLCLKVVGYSALLKSAISWFKRLRR